MKEFTTIIEWFFSLWQRFYYFIIQQHPIFQMRVFLPAALLVVSLFISFVGKNERSP